MMTFHLLTILLFCLMTLLSFGKAARADEAAVLLEKLENFKPKLHESFATILDAAKKRGDSSASGNERTNEELILANKLISVSKLLHIVSDRENNHIT